MAKGGKSLWKLLLKITISAAAMTIVFSNIDWAEVKGLFLRLHCLWLCGAIFFFAFSKVFSAFRLTLFLKSINIVIDPLYNLRLAWLGMFYNLFLPGGIGGDAYKIYLLSKQYAVKAQLIGASVLLDRINGVAALAFLAGAGFLSLELDKLPSWAWWAVLALTLAICPIYILGAKLFFRSFQHNYLSASLLSICTQVFQVVAGYFLLQSLNIHSSESEYLVLFLISSIVAVLPFTIGGVGARELTFIVGSDILGINQSSAVAYSLLFFLVTLFVSALGGFVSVKKKQLGN